MEVRELTGGSWRWTAPHPECQSGFDCDRAVGLVAAETTDPLALIDPLVLDDGRPQLDALVAALR